MTSSAANPYSSLSEHEFTRRVTAQQITVLRIIQGSLMAGVTLFAAVVIILYFQSTPASGADTGTVYALSLANVLIAFSMTGLSRFLAQRIYAVSRTAAASPGADLYSSALNAMRTAVILRMAILESSAFFGIIVALIAVTEGIARTEPLFLLNMCAALPLIVVGAITFPTAERLRESFIHNFRQPG